jgi:VWFA-related protein
MRFLPVAALLLSGVAVSAQSPAPASPASGTPAQGPASQPPRRATTGDRTGAIAVVVDVVVRDSRGRPVVTLTRDDFEVYEDGVRQPIGSFRAPAAGAAARPADAPASPTGAPAAPRARPEPAVMALIFDRLSIESRKLAVDAVRGYLGDGAQTANVIGAFSIDQSLGVLQPFTQDAAALRKALDRVPATRPTTVDPMGVTDLRGPMQQGLAGRPGSGRPADDLTIAMSALTGSVLQSFGTLHGEFGDIQTLHALGAVSTGLSLAPGRKAVVLFTEGVGLTRNNDVRLHALIDQANRSNVAIYTVDAAGLRAGSHTLMAGRYAADAAGDAGVNQPSPAGLADMARLAPEAGLGILANETGGQRIDSTNDLSKAFPRLDEDLRSYYALTYASPRSEPDGKFHKIEVKLRKPGLTPKTRSGYVSLPPAAGAMPVLAYEAPALARLESARLPNELPILARAFVFPHAPDSARVPLLVSIPARALEYTRDEAAGTYAADAVVLVRVRDTEGRVVHKASEQYAVSGPLAALETSRRSELLFYRQPQLPAGVYTFEAIVVDNVSGKASARLSSVDVAPAAQAALRVGTPFIVRRAEAAGTTRDAANPLYFGEVLLYPNLGQPLSKTVDKELAFGFAAYDGSSGPLEATLQLLRSGQPVATVPLTLGAADATGRISQIGKLPLEPLEPGSYELRVTVSAGTQRVTRGVPFAIAAGN